MAEALLQIQGLESGYGDVQVLWGVDLEVRAGEIVCLIGSNGAGKTTLLKTAAGLIAPARGTIRAHGALVGGRGCEPVLRAGITLVPEGRRLFPTMSVQDNLLMGAYLRPRNDPGVREDLEQVLTIFPRLRERARQDAATLSGGEQQMCALGRGIMSRPRLLMIDELSLGLAPRAVEQLSAALVEINRTGISILLVEQDVMTALDLAHRGYVLDRGRIAMSGDARELSGAPEVREAYVGVS